MLKRLYISNYALIDEMDVCFPGKLTVITGETGAGKSIFLEALGLALGNRADQASLKNKNKKCIIEAVFDVSHLDLQAFFEEQGLDPEKELLLRREINAEGKSRLFVNDALVNLSTIKRLAESLVDIHSQHQTLLLNQGNFQLELLDAFAGSLTLYKEYKHKFSSLSRLKNKLSELQNSEASARKELDYLNFLFNELQESEIRPGLLKELEEESSTLENAESIKSHLASAAFLISGSETNLLSSINGIKQSLQQVSKFNKSYEQYYQRSQSIYIELKELGNDLEGAESEISPDTKKLEEINAAMDKLNRLLKKHAVTSEEQLLASKAEIEQKLNGYSTLENEIKQLEKEIEKTGKDCFRLAEKISGERKKCVPEIEKQVKEMLGYMAMANAQFKIELSQNKELSLTGLDTIKLMFTANKGSSLNELNKVASGGELSRLMLSLKALLATKKNLPSIIFDEIDTGVSGDVADKIGSILNDMGKNMQVLAITHLPQMASKGNHHLFVYKKDTENKTISYIKELSPEERVMEIAKMLSAGKPGAPAIENAKELLEMRRV